MTTPRLKRSILGAVGGAALLILTAGAAQATCIGTCGTDTANGDVTNPPGFSSYHFVTTTGGPAAGGNLPSVFGSPGVNSTNGSTFTTAPFTATAGDSVNFYFNYVTSDGSGFPDYAWAALLSTTGGQNYLIFTAQTQPSGNTVPGKTMPPLASGASLVPPTSPITLGSGTKGPGGAGGPVWAELGSWSGYCFAAGCGLTGWIQSLFDGEAADTYVLEFGVSNTNDTLYDSGLAYAGVTVGGKPIDTPEPGGLALFGAGLFAVLLGYRLARRRQITG